MNLLQETLSEIVRSKHVPANVVFIGSRDGTYACTWDEFCTLADRDYDNGYGGQRVADDIVVRFADGGWLERWDYDGSEGWTYRAPFRAQPNPKQVDRVIEDDDYGSAYAGLNAMHTKDEW